MKFAKKKRRLAVPWPGWTFGDLGAIGRNLNTMARLLQQDARQAVPGRQEVLAMLRIGEALRDHVRALIKANLISWDIGHAEQSH